MTNAAAVIRVGSEREQRKVLAVKIVLQIEHARETGPGDLRLGPGTVGIL